MIFGEERLFYIDTYPNEKYNELNLRSLDEDVIGIKTRGDFPKLWKTETDNSVSGPQLFDDDYVYNVVKVDYGNKIMWVEQI